MRSATSRSSSPSRPSSSYLRPSEGYAVRNLHLLDPVCQAQGHRPVWALLIRPREEGVPTKVGVYDDALAIDDPRLSNLGNALSQLRARREPSAPLFEVSPRDFSRVCNRALMLLGLKKVGLKMYSLFVMEAHRATRS